jgi:hypothetical protein
MDVKDTARRVQVVLGSLVFFVTGAAVLVNEFASEVIPALPEGWQDNAAHITTAVLSVLALAAFAVRRLTPVPVSKRGLLPRKRKR